MDPALSDDWFFSATLPSDDPQIIRRLLLDDLKRRAKAQIAMLYRVNTRRDSAHLLLHDAVVLGSPPLAAIMQQLEGQPMLEVMTGPDGELDLHTTLTALTARNDFEVQRLEDMTPGVRQIWEQLQIHSSVGMNACLEDEHMGWFGAFRTADAPPLALAELALDERLIAAYLAQIEAAHAIEAAQRYDTGFAYIVDQSGQVLTRSASSMAREWLAHGDHQARLIAQVEDVLRRKLGISTRGIGLMSARLLPVRDGHLHRCVVVMRPTAPLSTAVLTLSRAERALACLVADGDSIAEISQALGESEAAIVERLDAIYTRLGVKTEAELTQLLTQFFSA